jgi:hypothetical protein
MIVQQAPTFLPQAAGQKAICRIQRWAMTLKKITLRLGGTSFTPALIDFVRVKIGAHTIWEVTGTELQAVNAYKGLITDNFHLTLDFSERDAKDIVGEEIGGIDMSKLGDDIFIEVDINASASAPTLRAILFLTPPQGDTDPRQLIKKLLRMVSSSLSSGRQDIVWSPNGALLQRMYIRYTGSDWVAGTATSSATAGNTGNGTMGAITVSSGAKTGDYTLMVIEPGANVGTFEIADPDGNLLPTRGVVASAYSAHGLAFTLADGATDFVSGDSFTITVSAANDGNVADLRVKKNGVPLWDDVKCSDNRELQKDYKKVPQARTYVYDPIADNNQSAAVITADAANLQIQPNLTAGDTLTTLIEVLDIPNNL